MAAESRHYFVYGNTAQGFVSKLPSNLQGIDRLFIIRGKPGSGKACVMPFVAAECEKTGCRLEHLHCPSAPDTFDGIIIPEKRLAVIDGTDLHFLKLITSEPPARYIDTGALFPGDTLKQHEDNITDAVDDAGICHDRAFLCFQDALRVHDEWEKIYIENMDFSKADAMTSETGKRILGDSRTENPPVLKERFFGASTPAGALDFLDKLTANISKRYFLKGRPGTGKSTLLRKLAAASAERGLDTEIYSCAFDSKSLDALIWPALDKCLFDSTAPHLYEPSRPSDEVIDMYAGCVKPGTDEKYEKELADITCRYKQAIQNGTQNLSDAKVCLDGLLAFYAASAESGKVHDICAEFIRELHL